MTEHTERDKALADVFASFKAINRSLWEIDARRVAFDRGVVVLLSVAVLLQVVTVVLCLT